jgi:hypothetical protein
VIGEKRNGLKLTNEMQVTGLAYDDCSEWEVWNIGLKRKLRSKNVKLLLEDTAQENIHRQI